MTWVSGHEINVVIELHGSAVIVGNTHADLVVKPPCPAKGKIKRVWSIGSPDDNHGLIISFIPGHVCKKITQ
jgi:hypothetical protein